ncbi:MAG: DUF1573 domain-containing protein [Chlorobi bacterium CHB2]|nr:DUF1573 domain-containing protein [Chlorobi bacterium CHB2]
MRTTLAQLRLPSLLLAAAIAFPLLGGCQEKPLKAAGPPKIEIVGGELVDWGKTAPGTLKRTVQIVNNGGDTLKISKVQPSCGCTTAPLSKENLRPGDTATLDISLNTPTHAGETSKTITIMSNDSLRPSVMLRLKAFIMREIVASPDFFPAISDVKPGQEGTTEIELLNTAESPVTIQPPTFADAPEMLVRFDMAAPVVVLPGEKVKVVAHAKPLKAGMSSGEVVFKTDSKINPEVKVRITCNAS